MVSELAEELMAGRGLSIPLREGLVYRGKPKHLQDEIAHELAESRSIASNSPAQSRVLAEKAVNLGSPRPKMQLKRAETEPDIFDIKAMRESVDELQDLRAGAVTPPDPLGPIRADSPRVVKTQQNQSGQMGTPRKVAMSRTMRESRASPRRADVEMKAPAQPVIQRKTQQALPDLQNEVIDLTRSPPMFKTKSSLRIPKPKRTAQVDEVQSEKPEHVAGLQQQQQQQPEMIQQPLLATSRRLPSTLRMSRTVSDHSGRTTPSGQDEPVQPVQRPTTTLYESRTLGRARRPATVSRTSSNTNTTSSPNAITAASAAASAAAAAAFKTSPQALKVQQVVQKQIVIPESPVRIVSSSSSSRPVPPRRATSRTVSTTRAEALAAPVNVLVPGPGAKITLEAAIEAAAAQPVAVGNTIRRAPRRARTAGADGVEGLLLEALTAGDRQTAPLSGVSREGGLMGTIARRPRRAGVCYD